MSLFSGMSTDALCIIIMKIIVIDFTIILYHYHHYILLYSFEIMTEKYSLNEVTYSFMASIYVGGRGGAEGGSSQIMTQYDRNNILTNSKILHLHKGEKNWHLSKAKWLTPQNNSCPPPQKKRKKKRGPLHLKKYMCIYLSKVYPSLF